MTIFTKHFILIVWQGSAYASGLLKLFCYGSKKDTQECLIYTKLFIVFTPKSEFFPYFEVIQGNTTFKVTKGHDVWCSCSFIFFIPMFYIPDISVIYTQKWNQTRGMCAHAITCKWKNQYTYELRIDFIHCSNFFIVDFKQVNVDWVTWKLSTSLI